MSNVACKIYSLSSTSNNEVRYIGQTTQKLNRRLSQHICYAKKKATAVTKWIMRELELGFKININLLNDNAVFNLTEIEAIKDYRLKGFRLLNLTDGGEGTLGWRGNKGNKRPDLAARNRLGKGKPGRATTQETKDKISKAHKGRKAPWLSERNKLGKGKPGHPHTDESRAKISAALKGRKITWGDKISKAKRGLL